MEAVASPCMYLTLTYDSEYYTCGDQNPSDWLKSEWKSFYKTLKNRQKAAGIPDFKYYAISERGEEGRLHFHVLLFGLPFTTFRAKNPKGQYVDYVRFSPITEFIQNCWNRGFITFEGANGKAIRYVTKYIHKRVVSSDYISMKSNGIGLAFLTEERKKFFKDNDTQEYHLGNKIVFLPRYLKKKIWTDEKEYQEMSERLIKKLSERESALCKQKVPNGDLFVTIRESDLLIRAAKSADLDSMRLSVAGFSMSLGSVREALDKCGIIYDQETDEMNVIFFYKEDDPLVWFRQKRYDFDNMRYKTCFNRRL